VNISISLVNIFLSPIAVGIARQRSRARKHENFYHQGIAIYCSAEQVPMLKSAVDELIEFYGDDWSRYRRNLKWIILDNELQTILWVARRATIIQESDANRMSSPEQFVAGLVYDCERVLVHRKYHASTIFWKKGLVAMAHEQAAIKRNEYLNGD
jgi:hypothetical protein